MVKKVALVIAEHTFRDEEYRVPKEILERAGINVVTVSTTLGTAVGKLGMKVTPDLLLVDLKEEQFDALIFIGGGGSSQYFNDVTALELVKQFFQAEKIVGAICIAPVILANAGVLQGKKATVFPDGAERLKAGGANYTGNQVDIDGQLITACGPEAATDFGNTLVKMLITEKVKL